MILIDSDENVLKHLYEKIRHIKIIPEKQFSSDCRHAAENKDTDILSHIYHKQLA